MVIIILSPFFKIVSMYSFLLHHIQERVLLSLSWICYSYMFVMKYFIMFDDD